MRGGRCGASRLLLSLPETGRLLLSGQAKLPVAHSCQRSALHHSAASTRLGSGAPGPAGGGTGSPNPPTTLATRPVQRPRSPHPPARCSVDCAGVAGHTWARRRAEQRGSAAAAPSRRQFALRFAAEAGECGNRSGAGSSGEAAGLLHIRVLTPRLPILPARPAPHSPPEDPACAASCLRGSGHVTPPENRPGHAFPEPPWSVSTRQGGALDPSRPAPPTPPDPTWPFCAGTWCRFQPLPSPRPLALQPALPSSRATRHVLAVP